MAGSDSTGFSPIRGVLVERSALAGDAAELVHHVHRNLLFYRDVGASFAGVLAVGDDWTTCGDWSVFGALPVWVDYDIDVGFGVRL